MGGGGGGSLSPIDVVMPGSRVLLPGTSPSDIVSGAGRMLGGGKQTSETVSTPSPYDVEKAKTAELLRNALVPLLMPGMIGMPTPEGAKANSQKQSQNVKAASQLKLAPGSPQIGMAGGLTGANSNMMNYAMQLYGMMPSGPGSSETTGQYRPGGLDYLQSAMGLGQVYGAGKQAGWWGGESPAATQMASGASLLA